MFIYSIIRNAIPDHEAADPETIKGWAEVARAWLGHTTNDPAEIDQAIQQMIADGTIKATNQPQPAADHAGVPTLPDLS